MSDALLPRRVSRLVEILQLLIPHVLGSNPTHNFVLYLPVSILRVIINVRCAFTKKSESDSGNTSTSYSTCLGSNPTHNFVLYLPVSILRVIINVRCAFTKKSESSSGNTSTSYSHVLGSNPLTTLFYICLCPF